MTKRNGENERVKRRYLVYLKDAKGRDNASIDAAAGAVERFEEYVKRRDFRNFHIEQARGFKAHLFAATNTRNGKPLSASTDYGTLAALKAFFVWLADQPGYASRIKYADAEYFNAPDNVSRIATAGRFKSCPTVTQVRAMIDALANETEIEKRDRALVAFTILSGARDRAIVSFRLKNIDIERGLIEQDSRKVRTKRAKTFTSWFFPVGDDIRRIVVDWVAFLREEKGFGPRLGPVERLDLAFLVDGHHCRVAGRVHVDTDDIIKLGGEVGIVESLEGPDPVRLELMGDMRWKCRSKEISTASTLTAVPT